MCTKGFVSKDFPSSFEDLSQIMVVMVFLSPTTLCVLWLLAEGMWPFGVSYSASWSYLFLVLISPGEGLDHMDK